MRIGITGGKGGTGKSTVATALAYFLARKRRVLLVDADVDCPNDHLLLGIERKLLRVVKQRVPVFDSGKCTQCADCGRVCRANALVTVAGNNPYFVPAQCTGCGACEHVCPADAISWGEKEVGFIYEGEKHGISFLSGELKVKEPVSERVVEALNSEIKKREKEFEFVLIDTAAGTHCDVVAALQDVDLVLAVTEPTPLGLHDLKLILDLLIQLGKPFEVVLNRYEGKTTKELDKVLAGYGKKIAVFIPYDENIVRAYAKGEPIEHESIEQITRILNLESGILIFEFI